MDNGFVIVKKHTSEMSFKNNHSAYGINISLLLLRCMLFYKQLKLLRKYDTVIFLFIHLPDRWIIKAHDLKSVFFIVWKGN